MRFYQRHSSNWRNVTPLKLGKASVSIIGLAGLLALSTPVQCQTATTRPDVLFATSPNPVAEAAPLDEFLLSMSLSFKVNVLADVTNIAPEPLVQPYPGGSTAKLGIESRERDYWAKATGEEQLVDLIGQRHLSVLRYNPETLLFWNEPPLIPLSKQILAERSELWKSYGDGTPPTGSTSWRRYWEKFLRQQGWDGKAEDVDIQVKLADLPPEVANQVLYQIWMERFRRDEMGFLTEAGWGSAKLVKCRGNDGSGTPSEYLAIKIFSVPPDPLPYGYTQMPVIMTIGKLTTNEVGAQTPQTDSIELIDEYALGDEQNKAPVVVKSNEDNTQNSTGTGLDKDPKLSTTINLEAKRVSLEALLAELAKQSGIAFEVAPEAKAIAQSKLIVARFSDMPLSDVMSTLSRLYGVQWRNKAAAYVLDFFREDWTQQQLRQVGDPVFYRTGWLYRPADLTNRKQAEFAAKLTAAVGEAALGPLQTGEIAFSDQYGVPVSSLPEALQVQLRQYMEVKVAMSLPKWQLEANSIFKNSSDLILRFRRESSPLLWVYRSPEGETTIASSDKYAGDRTERDLGGPVFRFTVLAPDGELICPVLSSLSYVPKTK